MEDQSSWSCNGDNGRENKWRAEEAIAGNSETLKALRELIEFPLLFSQEAKKIGLRWPRGLLLYGPPGTGKTSLVRAVVRECGAHLTHISPHTVHKAHAGESEEALRKAFSEASSHAISRKPSVIFIDEIDALCPRRDSRRQQDVRITTQLSILMDSNKHLESGRPQYVVVASTNRVDAIDPALRRSGRFDAEIEVTAPTEDERYQILRLYTKKVQLDPEVDLRAIAASSNGFVGADLEALCREAALAALQRCSGTNEDAILNLTTEDWKLARSIVSPSMTRGAPVSSLLEIGGVAIAKDDIVRDDPTNNVPDNIFSKLGMQLHRKDNHPLGILKNEIYNYFDMQTSNKFDKFDDLSPIVSVKENFDDVLVPADHVSRSFNDTYYINSQTVLRCHTSAHQAELLRRGYSQFLVTGDVYRRDSIDSTHYPVFHQMEGVHVFSLNDWEASGTDGTSYAADDLKKCLEGLARHLFGAVEMRWVNTYFPFTNPSFELEIFFQEKWLEVLGCGVMEQEILKRSGKENNVAWAFGLGLERLAMVLFDIPDIRLFWSVDERFTSQFWKVKLGVKFKPFSKFPPCYKDISFWINESFTENNLCEVVRGIAGDLVEEVQLIDNFTNKQKGMTSHCYRIAYRSMERSLTDEEINDLQGNVREQVQSKLNVVLR